MALQARIEHALTSSGVNTTWGPIILVAAQIADVILALRTLGHSLPLKTAARCVLLGAPCCCKFANRCLMAVTAHTRKWPVAPFPMDSTLKIFYML